MNGPLIIAVSFYGACLGSFANCMAYRVRHGLKWWGNERSACPSCSAAIRWFDNLPVLSYLMLGGKCRKCGAAIPWRYLLAEVGGGLVLVAIVAFVK